MVQEILVVQETLVRVVQDDFGFGGPGDFGPGGPGDFGPGGPGGFGDPLSFLGPAPDNAATFAP